MAGRLQALRSEGSTRLGTALRLATRHLVERRGTQRRVVPLSYGSQHDIDAHDPAYLIEDARHAISGAARQGVRRVLTSAGEKFNFSGSCLAIRIKNGTDKITRPEAA